MLPIAHTSAPQKRSLATSQAATSKPSASMSSIVPYRCLVCVGCGRRSNDPGVNWGANEVTYDPNGTVLTQTPSGNGCLDCKACATDALLPEKLNWQAFADELQSSPQKKRVFQEWSDRRQGKKSSHFAKSSVKEEVRVGMRWEESFAPHTLAELEQKNPGVNVRALPDFPVESVTDNTGKSS